MGLAWLSLAISSSAETLVQFGFCVMVFVLWFWDTGAVGVIRECLCLAQVAIKCEFAAIGYFVID